MPAERTGARLVLFPAFDPDLVLAVIKKRPATFLPAVPPIYERLVKAAAAKKVWAPDRSAVSPNSIAYAASRVSR